MRVLIDTNIPILAIALLAVEVIPTLLEMNGYIPHWDTIINKTPQYREAETKKLLYVVCSRAKKNLYLFSEQGRTTRKGYSLTATDELMAVSYNYDGDAFGCICNE
jgi:hypothetical protein